MMVSSTKRILLSIFNDSLTAVSAIGVLVGFKKSPSPGGPQNRGESLPADICPRLFLLLFTILGECRPQITSAKHVFPICLLLFTVLGEGHLQKPIIFFKVSDANRHFS